MKKERFICVEWEDASSNSGFYDPDNKELFNPVPCQTVGHLIKKDRQKVLVASERFFYSDNTTDNRKIQTIPRKIVKRIRYLRDK